MTRQAYLGSGPRFLSLAVLSAVRPSRLRQPGDHGRRHWRLPSGTGGTQATGGTTGTGGTHTGGTTGTGGSATGGSIGTGGTHTGGSTGTGGSATGGSTGTGGSATGGSTGTGGSATGGSTGTGGSATGGTTGTGGTHTGGTTGTGGAAGGSGSCSNTNTSTINEDASGYICGNQWGIQGAWYCYTSDTSNACNKTGAIPWNASSSGMCLSGSIASGGTALMGFKVNSGPPGGTATPGSWNASQIVGFAVTLASGSSGKGSGGSVLYIEYPTTKNVLSNGDAPGVTVPGVAGSSVTYNALFSDSLLANSTTQNSVDPTVLTDFKLAIPPDVSSRQLRLLHHEGRAADGRAESRRRDGLVRTGLDQPTGSSRERHQRLRRPERPVRHEWASCRCRCRSRRRAAALGSLTTPNAGSSNNGPASFPAVVSGWGPGDVGIQFYGPYKGGKTIGGTSQLTSVMSSWSFTMGGSGDAVYDVWFGNSANANSTADRADDLDWQHRSRCPSAPRRVTPSWGGPRTQPPITEPGNKVVSYWVASPGTTQRIQFRLAALLQGRGKSWLRRAVN